MIYTTQLRRKKAAAALAALLKSSGPGIAKQLEPRMAAVLEEGEKMPDLAHLLDVLGRMLKLESEGLEAASDARSAEGSEVKHARRELRDRAEPELRKRVTWVRAEMRKAYGAKETNRMLTLPGRTPRGRDDLQAVAEKMVSFLPEAEPPEEKPGSKVTPAEWAEYVKPALADFDRCLARLGNHSENQVEIVEQKKQALATFDRNYSRIIRLAELFYELAGMESLIKHLRYHPGRSTRHPKAPVKGRGAAAGRAAGSQGKRRPGARSSGTA